MADLIIKPAVGGNLLIQDRAGGAVLSTGTSGAAIASGVTGGAGLSGMTSLGTVTAGNLSNSAIVYPAGHVIQVKRKTCTPISSASYNIFNFSSSTASVVTVNSVNLEVTGFSATAGNILYVTWNHGLLSTYSGNTCLCGVKIGSTPYSTGFFQGGTSGAGEGRYRMESSFSLVLGSSISNTTISAVVSSPNNTAAYLAWYAYTAGSFTHTASITVMEIQQ